MSQITVTDLSFYYDGSYDNIFENVSFQIDTDWKLGFVGRNGRGKTTFLNLLRGKYEYKGGISASVEFDYFPFTVERPDENTLDVIAGIYPEFENWRLYKELNLLKVEEEVLYRPFNSLSNGEQTKVLLALLFLKEKHFLLIDEPTNHLDGEARTTVSHYLKEKNGFILVSHDRNFLNNCVDHILAINKTNLEVVQGSFDSWWQNKTNQDEYERQENERLKKDIRKLSEAARRTERWSDQVEKSKIGTHAGDRGAIGHKAAKMMKRAKSVESRAGKAAEVKKTLLKNVERADDLKLLPLTHQKDRLLHMEAVSLYYGEKRICGNIGLMLTGGQRIALEGENGCGKSSLLKKIMGENLAHTGTIEIASGLVISYVPQDTSHLKGSLAEYALAGKLDETLFRAVLRQLDFGREQFDKDMEGYSDGQKKKVLLARSLCERAHLYLWDEPLNYIDIFSRIQIENLILAHRPTLLFVEHDKAFTDKIATAKISLTKASEKL